MYNTITQVVLKQNTFTNQQEQSEVRFIGTHADKYTHIHVEYSESSGRRTLWTSCMNCSRLLVSQHITVYISTGNNNINIAYLHLTVRVRTCLPTYDRE